jgi:hypothetical protein
MEIKITGASAAPDWNMLQDVIRQVTKHPKGILTKIGRADKGVDYRAIGDYNLAFAANHGACSKPISLTITN